MNLPIDCARARGNSGGYSVFLASPQSAVVRPAQSCGATRGGLAGTPATLLTPTGQLFGATDGHKTSSSTVRQESAKDGENCATQRPRGDRVRNYALHRTCSVAIRESSAASELHNTSKTKAGRHDYNGTSPERRTIEDSGLVNQCGNGTTKRKLSRHRIGARGTHSRVRAVCPQCELTSNRRGEGRANEIAVTTTGGLGERLMPSVLSTEALSPGALSSNLRPSAVQPNRTDRTSREHCSKGELSRC